MTVKTLYAMGVAFWALTIVWLELGLLPVLVFAAMTELALSYYLWRSKRAERVEIRRRKGS